MDEAEQGPGPRDPEIPQQPGVTSDGSTAAASADTGEQAAAPPPSDADWTRNLTTIAVVAPKPRPAPVVESVPAVEPSATSDGDADADAGGEADAEAVVDASEDGTAGPESAAEQIPGLPRRGGDLPSRPVAEDAASASDEASSPKETEPVAEAATDDTADARLKSLVAAWVAVSDTDTDTDADTDEAEDEAADSPTDVPEADVAAFDAFAPKGEAPGDADVDDDSDAYSDVAAAFDEPAEPVASSVGDDAVDAPVLPASDADVAAESVEPPEGDGGAVGAPAAADPDTALLNPVEAASDPDTALLKPVGESGAKGADLDSWVASLGARPAELEAKAADAPAEADASDGDGDGGKESVPARRRFINPWLGGAAAIALLLAGAAAIDNPFTIATAERVPVSDVPRMSDPEPDQNSGPVNGGLPANLELPPLLPAAAPGSSASPSQSASASGATSGRPFTLPPAQTPASTVTGSNGIPQLVLSAYKQAAEYMAKADPKCRLPWELLAGIGRVESGHANGGQVSTTGSALTPILGPRLDGTNSTRAIRDTDRGVFDFDTEFDRAVGPMQFIPTSWNAYAMDGNKDGKKDPQNIYDATLTAGRYLCAGDRDLSTEAGLDKAIFSYNQSPEYVRTVKAWTAFYRQGVRPITVAPPPAPSRPATSSKPPPSTPSKQSTSKAPTSASPSPSSSRASSASAG